MPTISKEIIRGAFTSHELYPLESKNARQCMKAAIAKASPQVENAIAGATKEAKAE